MRDAEVPVEFRVRLCAEPLLHYDMGCPSTVTYFESVSIQTRAPHDRGLSGEYTTLLGPLISTSWP